MLSLLLLPKSNASGNFIPAVDNFKSEIEPYHNGVTIILFAKFFNDVIFAYTNPAAQVNPANTIKPIVLLFAIAISFVI
jgi:hypothetical protein